MARIEPERWARVAPSWLGHRAEPLIHERTWACPLELSGGEVGHDGRVHEAGFDAAGRPLLVRRSGRAASPRAEAELGEEFETEAEHREEIETVEYRGREIVVNLVGRTVATTAIDEHGRPLRTVYSGAEEGEETYHYGSDGRLVAIDEARCLWRTVSFYEMWEPTGGRLTVEHDDQAPARITDSAGGTRWARCDEQWPRLLERGAEAICEAVMRVAEAECGSHGVPPTTEVSDLVLTYFAQGSLQTSMSFGLGADRRLWIDAEVDADELGTLDRLLLQEAAYRQPRDPYRVVLGAAAARLARHDWRSLLTTSDDFTVHVAEHDEEDAPY
jgi:hypothetical protein